MKSKIYHMAICAGLLLLAGCDKNCSPEPDPCEVNPTSCDTTGPVTKLDIVWRSLVNPDTSFGLPKLLLSSRGVVAGLAGATSTVLRTYDAENGEILWSWQELFVDNYSSMGYHNESDLIYIQNWSKKALVRGSDGTTSKVHMESGTVGNPFGHILGEYYYYTWRDPQDTVAKLLRSHITDFTNWDTLYTVRRSEMGGSRPNIQSYNLWVDPETGDSILIFQHRMSSPNRVDVVAWNMKKRRVEWRHNDIEPNGNSSIRQVFIYADKAYFQGVNTIYCFRLADGEILWQHRYLNPLNSFLHGNIVYASQEDLILVKGDGSSLIAYRPETGTVAWQKNDIEYGGAIMTYHDGIVYFANDRLIAVRASNGQVIWSERSPSRVTQPTFSGTVAIDPVRGLLYACDQYYVMAIRLPE